jgi:site-specific recombinase XerC
MQVMCAFSSSGSTGKHQKQSAFMPFDEFIEWQQRLGRAPATIRRRLIALRTFFDYLAYICEDKIANPVIPHRHYIDQSHRLPRDIHQEDIEKLFQAIGDHLRAAHPICGLPARFIVNGWFIYPPLLLNYLANTWQIILLRRWKKYS